MKYLTSDGHLGENRIGVNGKPNLFYRPFSSTHEQDYTIMSRFMSRFKDGDELIHVGDAIYEINADTEMYFERLKFDYPNSKFTLVRGNYDTNDKLPILKTLFDEIVDELEIEIKEKTYYVNHYPVNCIGKGMSITGHIHGLWKVQKNMINVGVDAWHFYPVSEAEIDFCATAIEKYYDENVFPY